MAFLLRAQVDGRAFNLRVRVSFVAGRARAHGHVIFRQADCVDAARLRLADGLAFVAVGCDFVARHGRRTVGIGETFDLYAAVGGRGVSGVQTFGTLAFGDVVVGHADGAAAALERLADGRALPDTLRIGRSARLRFAALGVAVALVLGYGTAAVAVVGVSGESAAADALAGMVGGAAVRVGRAGEVGAHVGALPNAQQVGTAGLVVGAVRVGRAVGQRWFLAQAADRMAHEIGLTFAERFGVSDATNFVGRTRGGGARINAVPQAVDVRVADRVAGAFVVAGAPVRGSFLLAAGLRIVGVSGKSVLADARRPVIVDQARGVWTTLDARACVDAATAAVGH